MWSCWVVLSHDLHLLPFLTHKLYLLRTQDIINYLKEWWEIPKDQIVSWVAFIEYVSVLPEVHKFWFELWKG